MGGRERRSVSPSSIAMMESFVEAWWVVGQLALAASQKRAAAPPRPTPSYGWTTNLFFLHATSRVRTVSIVMQHSCAQEREEARRGCLRLPRKIILAYPTERD